MRIRVLAIAVLALACTLSVSVFAATPTPDPFLTVNTHGLDAVSLQLSHEEQPLPRILVREGEMASIQMHPDKIVGIKVKSISLRGDQVTLGLYELKDKNDRGVWIEDITIDQKEVAEVPAATARFGGRLQFTLQFTRLETR